MSKRHSRFLSFLLIFSILVPCVSMAEGLVGLKNLSWEEQKNQTRIILETSEPLVYNIVAATPATEFQVELSNLDLRNLPQELFINTDQVVSLQTFPQTGDTKARIIVKMTSALSHKITTDGNRMFVDVLNGASNDGLLAPTAAPNPAPAAKEPSQPVAAPQTSQPAPVTVEPPAPEVPQKTTASVSSKPATEIRDVRVVPQKDSVDVVLVGNGSFDYDVFQLSNPDRIVVDLKAVTVAPNVRSLTSTGVEMISKVRVAQYQTAPKVARAVVDLSAKTPYSVVASDKELKIHVGAASDDAEASPDHAEIAPANDQTSAPADTQPQAEPATAKSNPDALQSEPAPVATAEAKPAELPKSEPASVANNPQTPVTNEQFFSFQPDTSLFAQEGGTSETAPPPAATGDIGGMGTFQDKTTAGEKQYTGEPFSFDFKDIDIKDLFRFIADISGLNVILDPAVRGSVTLKLTEVPWDQALDLITKNEGLGYTIEGNVIRIAPLSKIVAEERQRAEAEKAQALNAPIITKIRPLSYAKASEVDRVIKRLLTTKGSSIIDNRTNTIIFTDINTNIDSIDNLITTLDSRTAQVLIEARIVETTKNFSQAFGIQWGFRGIVDPAFGNNTTLQFPNNLLLNGGTLTPTNGITGNPLGGYAVNLPTNSAPNSALLLSTGNILDTFRLDIALMALENTGNGRVISSPKVATQNNTKADILQGTQIPVQTIANNTVTTTFVNAALHLSVTPQITAEGTVIMDVTIENNRPDFNNVVFQTPPIVTESASTTLLVEDGGTTVIGGIFTASDQYSQGRTPVLHRIPLLGWLFKNSNIVRENRELLIFLTPRILR